MTIDSMANFDYIMVTKWAGHWDKSTKPTYFTTNLIKNGLRSGEWSSKD